ncbi:hypothetical protein A2229_03370 [Candidatus Peregrinibacteria bacterium RIFOXYA2_FULL_33_7]|nr:MAG: hypothetical protein A2229_03370 [Candidatus Peregrinibacteria bacterium RIFOXYA2_FULL_33_7]
MKIKIGYLYCVHKSITLDFFSGSGAGLIFSGAFNFLSDWILFVFTGVRTFGFVMDFCSSANRI